MGNVVSEYRGCGKRLVQVERAHVCCIQLTPSVPFHELLHLASNDRQEPVHHGGQKQVFPNRRWRWRERVMVKTQGSGQSVRRPSGESVGTLYI